MRFYIANNGDTLQQIANQFDIELEQLLLQNPSIANPHRNVEGLLVRLPSSDDSFGIPMCPPLLESSGLTQWIPLTPLEQMAETEYDVLIVGSGAGGGRCSLAIIRTMGKQRKKDWPC